MKNRLCIALAFLMVLGFVFVAARGQATKPAPPEKLADPAADALQTYLFTQNSNDEAGLKKAIEISAADKKEYSNAVISYMMWSRYLEKKAIEKFGKEDGIRVQGHARSYQDQYTLDFKRVRDANIQYNSDRTTATIYLRIELNRPENLQMGDRFNFLDVYEMVKTAGGWKLDFLKTYKCLDPDQEDNYKSELAAFPRMARVLSELADGIKKGTYKTADDLKNELDAKWAHVYDEPVRHNLKAGETMPADSK